MDGGVTIMARHQPANVQCESRNLKGRLIHAQKHMHRHSHAQTKAKARVCRLCLFLLLAPAPGPLPLSTVM